MEANFVTKIAVNAYKWISTRDNENAITYNRVFSWSTSPNSKEDISDCKALRDVAMAINFGQNRPKKSQKLL